MTDTGARSGLTTEQARARLLADGGNQLPQPERRDWLAIVIGVLREPMLLLLVAASVLYVVLGDAREAALLGASVLLVIGMTIAQEQRSEKALQALRELGSPKARVRRVGRSWSFQRKMSFAATSCWWRRATACPPMPG